MLIVSGLVLQQGCRGTNSAPVYEYTIIYDTAVSGQDTIIRVQYVKKQKVIKRNTWLLIGAYATIAATLFILTTNK